MRKCLLFSVMALLLSGATNAQDRYTARGADPGELYIANSWYALYDWGGHPHYKDVQKAIFRLTENGKKLTIQYDASYFYSDYQTTMVPDYILADATQGVVYSCHKQAYDYTSLWISFDYGKNWTFREETGFAKYYSGIYTADNQSVIYRGGGGMYFSLNFGQTWTKIENSGYTLFGDVGYSECEFFGLDVNSLLYTQTCFNTYTTNEIAPQFAGYDSDVYRGGLHGEVYVRSWFYESADERICKVSFSADTGQTFRHVYIDGPHSPYSFFDKPKPAFMSDREPGVFYIIKNYMMEDLDDLFGWYLRPCVYYYRDYGEILEGVFCHDLVRDYEYVEIPCEHTTDLVLEVINPNTIHLQWSNAADNIRGYHVFRNDTRITKEMLTDTFYLDADLSGGEYEY